MEMTESNMSWFGEKRPLVIDLGKAYSKFGVAGESSPRVVIRTPDFLPERIDRNFSCLKSKVMSEAKFRVAIENYLRYVYFDLLNIIPKGRKIILSEGLMNPIAFKNIFLELNLKSFEVSSVVFVPDVVATLYSCGINTGLVVDIGYSDTRVIPVLHGVSLFFLYTVADVGASSIEMMLKNFLRMSDTNNERIMQKLSMEQVEDIKIRYCYVQHSLGGSPKILNEDCEYKLNEFESVVVPAEARWKSCETLFGVVEEIKSGDSEISIQSAISSCLCKCSQEVREKVVQNILVCGGTAELRGFHSRVASELGDIIDKSLELKNLKEFISFGIPRASPMMRQWMGGSIYGLTNEGKEYMANDLEQGKIKDWSNQMDNYLFTS